jgi:hypothetical protein
MGVLDLFRRKPIEKRADGAGYTSAILAARAARNWLASLMPAIVGYWSSGPEGVRGYR